MRFSLKNRADRRAHIRGDPCAIFDCVALYGDVVDLPVSVGENKMLSGRDGLARLWLALSILQEAEMKETDLGQLRQGWDISVITVKKTCYN